MYHGLNNYKMYLRLKQDCEVAMKSLKNNLKLHEAFMLSSKEDSSFDTVQVGLLLKSLEITANALIMALKEEIKLFNDRFDYGLDLID